MIEKKWLGQLWQQVSGLGLDKSRSGCPPTARLSVLIINLENRGAGPEKGFSLDDLEPEEPSKIDRRAQHKGWLGEPSPG